MNLPRKPLFAKGLIYDGRMHVLTRRFGISILLVSALSAATGAMAEPAETTLMFKALKAACQDTPDQHRALNAAFPESRMLEARVTEFRGQPGRARHTLLLEDGSELRFVRLFPMGRLRRVSVEFHRFSDAEQLRPQLAVMADGQCQAREGRRIEYDADGDSGNLSVLSPNLETVVSSEALNPPVPDGRDPGGIAVAVIDTGVGYNHDFIHRRLARNADGKQLGYDFWDMDDRPFDLDTGRSPFFPLRHGTAVSSILLHEAPASRLIPYRFPRPRMHRMGDLVKHADQAGAVIASLSMGSSKREDWQTFEAAAKARPHMLFIVSAGNDGRDIDRRPVFPAALSLDNMLVVTSADDRGRLARGSNWGGEAVDVMVPGEQVPVIDHRGVEGRASGSSFAVPRVAALAARLLAKNPSWRGVELKRAILSRVRPVSLQGQPVLKHGWIPDPTDDYLPGQN